MPHITEPTIQESLWSWLTERGYEVSGEVSLPGTSRGIIDLVAHDPSADEYVGIEVKDSDDMVDEQLTRRSAVAGHTEKKIVADDAVLELWEQLARYQASGCFDRLYLACQSPSTVLETRTGDYARRQYEELDGEPSDIGGIRVPSLFAADEIAICREATELERSRTPAFSRTTEAWVQHHVWEQIGGIREAVVPNATTNTVRRIDIMAFTDSDDPTTVYYEQPEHGILGVEAKGAGGVTDPDQVRDQLHSYLQSGTVTHLYLAVPASKRRTAETILDDERLARVGLYVVEESGAVDRVRDADRSALRYDALRTKEGAYVDIGWGRHGCPVEKSADEYASAFDMIDTL